MLRCNSFHPYKKRKKRKGKNEALKAKDCFSGQLENGFYGVFIYI